MSPDPNSKRKSAWNLPTGQSLSFSAPLAAWVCGLSLCACVPAHSQIYDSLDAHPPRWYLDTSDCDARVASQENLADGGIDGGACEKITFTANNGTEALLIYPIEPTRPLDDLTANVSLMSARAGSRIGFRVRYPYLRDEETRRPVSVVVYGSSYERAGTFDSIGVGMIERALRLKAVAVRRQYGTEADMDDPYVDGVVINAYSGRGTTALRIDELRIDGLVPVGDQIVLGNHAAMDPTTRVRRPGDDLAPVNQNAFPQGTVTRILQHNGEPLSWVRSLGFDAVLIRGPPDAEILREAIRARVKIYSPPPSAPDPVLQPLLDPIAGWYLGSGEALDSRHIDDVAQTSRRLRSWPTRWQRPLVAAPAEHWRRYAALVDAIIDDLPIRNRGIPGGEEVAQMQETRMRVGDRVESGVGIVSMPAETMLVQAESIADLVGAPQPISFRWHSMWAQTMRSLESTPAAILFRSSRSLATGSELATQRSTALSYINRIVAMISPWVATASPAPPPPLVGAPYRCSRLTSGGTDLLILTTVAARGTEVLAGDGEVIDIQLSPTEATRTVWRLTHFSAERLTPEVTATGARIQIVSPDVAEIIVLSSDPSVGGSLAQSAARFARQAGLDRWQLASDLVRRTEMNWAAASATRVSDRAAPTNLVAVARRTLADAEPLYRAGDVDASLRMARRADAWALRSEWQLAEALMPNWPQPTSCPPMDSGCAEIQTAWHPLMDDAGWGINRIPTGSLDTEDLLGRWNFGKRMNDRVESEVLFAGRGTFQGTGALRARVTGRAEDALPGGYEGTAIQIRSPSVRVSRGTAIRIDVMVRTLGFGRPHQGVLVYDTIGGQELGVLIRGRADWTPVRLYRQAVIDGEVSVMFELIGAGEATLDDVQLRIWEPQSPQILPLRPIAQRTNRSESAAKLEVESTNR
jgi:hypothetical protein